MEGSFEIELSDLTDDAVRRLLKDAIRQQRLNSMPAGKRGAAGRVNVETDDDDGDNDAKVAMNRGGVKPNLPGVTTADLPQGVKPPKYKGRKYGKGA